MNNKDQKRLMAAAAAIQEAIDIAVKVANEVGGSIDIGPAYGMGGTYYSPGFLKNDLERHDNSEPYLNEKYAIVNQHSYYTSLETGGWVSSSMEC